MFSFYRKNIGLEMTKSFFKMIIHFVTKQSRLNVFPGRAYRIANKKSGSIFFFKLWLKIFKVVQEKAF